MSKNIISPEIRQELLRLKDIQIDQYAEKLIQRSSKTQRQDSFKEALVELNASFEDILIQVICLRFKLHEGKAKKLRFKKDRIRLLMQHNINYLQIDGYETAQTLSLIAQSITHEDAIVTANLDNTFPFWKEGFPMVQFDNAYKILVEDIHIHYQALIDTLLN